MQEIHIKSRFTRPSSPARHLRIRISPANDSGFVDIAVIDAENVVLEEPLRKRIEQVPTDIPDIARWVLTAYNPRIRFRLLSQPKPKVVKTKKIKVLAPRTLARRATKEAKRVAERDHLIYCMMEDGLIPKSSK